MEKWYVYIIDKKGRFYVGITTNVRNRMRQHGAREPRYLEGPFPREKAVEREKTLKGWSRQKKLILIERASS